MLRTDGIYVQFGYRPWKSWLGETGDCWYNMLKIVDSDNLVLLGEFNMEPFYEVNCDRTYTFSKDSLTQYYSELGSETHKRDDDKIVRVLRYSIDYENYEKKSELPTQPKTTYSYLNLETDDYDVLNIVQKLKDFNWSSLDNKIVIRGINQAKIYYLDGDGYIANCINQQVNDPFGLVTTDKDSLYIVGSCCWIEGDEDEEKENSFKFTFVPFDLSEKSTWINEYSKWRTHHHVQDTNFETSLGAKSFP